MNNSFIWEMGYNNGYNTYVKKIRQLNNPTGSATISVSTNSIGSTPITKRVDGCTYYYLVTFWSDGSTDYQYLGKLCDSGGPSCGQTIAISKDSTTRIKSDCSVDVGGTNANVLDSISANQITNPCLQKAVNSIISPQNPAIINSITNILQNTFNLNNKVNLLFTQSASVTNQNGDQIDAKTTATINGNAINETISLNTSNLSDPNNLASQQYIASVIIHETIHAYLNTQPGILNASDSQHITMLTSYIPAMANALMSFYPDLTPASAVSLSLNGLNDLNLFLPGSATTIYNSPLFASVLSTLNSQFSLNLNNDPSSRDSWQNIKAFYGPGGDNGIHCTGNGKVN